MPDTAFSVISPQKLASAVVFASPHSGTDYTDSFLAQSILGRQEIRSSEDAFVDLLFQAAPEFGAPLLKALKPRAYLDLNRSPDELDPAVIDGVQRRGQNPRVASGLGVIPRVVAKWQGDLQRQAAAGGGRAADPGLLAPLPSGAEGAAGAGAPAVRAGDSGGLPFDAA